MTFRTLIRRSLRYHWRAHLGVALGAAIGSAALIGALVVGDSVRASLRERVLQRLGKAEIALATPERFFRWNLAADLQAHALAGQFCCGSLTGQVASVLRLPAMALAPDGTARANQVNVMEVDSTFGIIAADKRYGGIPPNEVLLNQALAEKLNAKSGDLVLLRVRKPSALSEDMAVSTRADSVWALRLRVHDIVAPEALGNFELSGGSQPPLNAFVARGTIPFRPDDQRVANIILDTAWGSSAPEATLVGRMINGLGDVRNLPGVGTASDWALDKWGATHPAPASFSKLANLDLWEVWRLADADHAVVISETESHADLKTPRVFLDPPVARVALLSETNAQPILTYLATLIQAGTNAAPYSMVTAAGAPWTPADLHDDEIVVSQWLAEDLQVKPGDEIALSYFLPESGVKLTEATNTFRVRSIVPLEMPWADRTLMPDFPGIEKAESTSEWDAGFPLTYKVRDKDDDYWKQHRGTPKAFVTLAAGQKMWGNRFGNLTAIRFPILTNTTTALTPALSPGERENHFQSQVEPKAADDTTASEKSKGEQRLSPLPGGEGQGEGERRTQTNQFETPHVVAYKEALEKKILANLKPEELGLRFEPVREQALKAAAESQDFGGLFLGFSFFVIAAALLLMALLFSLGLEQRAPEIGTLLALGFTPQQVRSLLLREGVALSFVGGVLGALGGLAYAKAMLRGLTTIWRDAVGASALSFHFTAQTLVIGVFASVVVSVVTIWLTLRKFVKRPARELLVGDLECGDSSPLSAGDLSPSSGMVRAHWLRRVALVIRRAAGRGAAWTTSRPSGESGDKSPHSKAPRRAIIALAAGVGLAGWAVATGDTANAGLFFGAGALVLLAGLSFASAWLMRLGGAPVSKPARLKDDSQRAGLEAGAPFTAVSLAVRGCARRRKRSLATVAMLACGSFLIVSIGVFRLDANRDATKKTSGTGGFALLGETTMPVVHDLNAESGRDFFALNDRDLEGVNIVPFRVREGDEASCLNLNAAQRPRLLGVKPEMLYGRFAFAKNLNEMTKIDPWSALTQFHLSVALDKGEIPAIGDANSIQWAMRKKVGDTIDYVDERGQPFKVRIVGAVANSILQGQLIIDEAEFVKRFPNGSGYRMFLLDAPSNAVSQVSATLSRAMQDVGLELTPAAQRLAQFNAVQNTYLGTFQVLGGLGLLLGSVGLGIVVLRNVLERRGELAVLLAVGFRKSQLQRLLLIENGTLLAAGLALGVVAAGVAVLPALLSPNAQLPYASLAVTLGAVLVNGALWTWAATQFAVRGDLLKALRNE